MSAHPVTTAADISPEAVESLAQYFDDCLSVCVDYDMHASLHADTCTKTAAQLRALRSALTASGELVHELRDALKSLSDMYAFPGESNTERFERVAERFYAETGVIAPGKDVSAGGWNGMTYEDRVKRFEDWYAEKAANARAAMEKANG